MEKLATAIPGSRGSLVALVAALAAAGGCMVGPDYVRPEASTAAAWIDASQPAVRGEPPEAKRWWESFGDPTLGRLVEMAYAQNLTLRAAGLRVLQAQARRAVAIGDLFPEQQQLSASYTRSRRSENSAVPVAAGSRTTDAWQAGFDAAWELDLWGKFRRAIEASDAELLGAVASYDDVLVSLVAEVAATYVRIRVLDERLAVAQDNVWVQEDSLKVAQVRFEAGGTSELDMQQATTLLRDTQATIPALEIQLRQSTDSLSVLLGTPPRDLVEVLGGPGHLPEVPKTVAVGIPVELLRRRPDVRQAELAAAAQSARIGVATADLLPAFQLVGTVGVSAEDFGRLFEGRSFQASGGPSITWPVLNYGRLVNNVRLQDATFQELATSYLDTVLTAQREVEDALVGYLRGTEQVQRLTESVAAANRTVEIALVQYREGATDYTAVLNAQQAKLRENDLLVSTRGSVALSTVALYKAVGGGWELREGHDFVPDATREEMRRRTYWGGLLPPASRERDVAKARTDVEKSGGLRWGGWWPEW